MRRPYRINPMVHGASTRARPTALPGLARGATACRPRGPGLAGLTRLAGLTCLTRLTRLASGASATALAGGAGVGGGRVVTAITGRLRGDQHQGKRQHP
jgi:hypothetical protein